MTAAYICPAYAETAPTHILAAQLNPAPQLSSQQLSPPKKTWFDDGEISTAQKFIHTSQTKNSATELRTTTPSEDLKKDSEGRKRSLNPDKLVAKKNTPIPISKLKPSASQSTDFSEDPVFIDQHDLANSYNDLAILFRKKSNRSDTAHEMLASVLVDSTNLKDVALIRNPYKDATAPSARQRKQLDPIQSGGIRGLIFIPYETFVEKDQLRLYYEKSKAIKNKIILAAGFSNINQTIVEEIARPYLGRPLTIDNLEKLANELKLIVRESNQPFANIYVPEQNIRNGVVSIVIRQASLQTIALNGNKQFTDTQILDEIDQKNGDPVYKEQLEKDIAWLNLHPNRETSVGFREGTDPNTTQMDINIKEDKVWRVFGSRSNDGSSSLDKNQYAAGFFYNNLWNADHRLFYQYGHSLDSKTLQTHSALYTAPLPWRHLLSINYLNSKAETALLGGAFASEGTFEQFGLDYDIPLYSTAIASNGWNLDDQNINLGFDHKISKGNVLFTLFGAPVQTGIDANVAVNNLMAGYSGKLTDPYQGETIFNAVLTVSPGGIGAQNNDEAFNDARSNIDSQYTYLTFSAERTMPLDILKDTKPFELATHVHGQISAERLISSERMLGGMEKGFRGYQPDSFSGDYGYGLAVDLSTPYWKISDAPLGTAIKTSVFMDTGLLGNIDPLPNEKSSEQLWSVGLAFNFILADNVSMSMTLAHDLSGQDSDDEKNALWRLLVNY